MKSLKFPVFAIAMVMALVSAFAFTIKPVANPTTSYHYIGLATDAQVKDPANWIEEPSDCDADGNTPCSIVTTLSRANFDLMVQGFSTVTDAKNAATTREFQ